MKLVDIVHEAVKEAMMFLGDNWIGTEPMGLISRILAWTVWLSRRRPLSMIADIPHVKYTEGRFLPYFFLDTFYE